MIKKTPLTIVFYLFITLTVCGQQNFSLTKYFVANPNVGAAIEFNQPEDMAKVENYVKSLIETGNYNFPDIYGANLTPNPTEWATYPDSVLWNVYYAYAAFSIYMDFSNKVPWKLSDLTREQLGDFFYTEDFFYTSVQSFGERSTPTSPLFTYSFLIEKNLIGKTRKETIERLIQWSRYRLVHFLGEPSPQNNYDHWQHNGGPPVERVISGTAYSVNGSFGHWAMGCWGSERFFSHVLRVINIPEKLKRIGNHAAMDFPSESLIMTHGDDLYGVIDELNDVEIHAKEILIPYTEIDSIMAVGFEGNEIVSYTGGKLYAKFFPLTWPYRPNDTTYTYTNFSNQILNYTRSDTTEQYHQIMAQARTRYSAVDVDRYNEISNLKSSDSLWYKKVYGLNPNAYLDTVLIPYYIGYAEIKNDSVFVYVDESTNEISPVFFRNADSFISIKSDSIINLTNSHRVTVSAEDSVLEVTYPIIKNIVPTYSVALTVTPEGAAEYSGDGFYLQGTNATIMAAPATGFRFVKWTEADTLVSENPSYTFLIQNNRSFVAHFDTCEYTITATINPENGGAVDGLGTYKHGETVELTAIPSAGYYFVGWKKNGYYLSFEPSISFIAEQDSAFIVEFAIIWHIVSPRAEPEDAGVVSAEEWYPHGTNVTVTAIPSGDYLFVNWTNGQDTVSNDPVYSFILERPVFLIAHFAKEYNITIDANPEEGGIVKGSGTYFSGTLATITATPNEGYRFVNISDNDDSEWVCWYPEYSFHVVNNRNLTVFFEKLFYSILAIPNDWNAGSISGAGDYEFGDIVEMVATPYIGYIFVNWTEDGTVMSTSQVYNFAAQANRNLVANFAVQTYTISATANPADGGTIAGIGSYDYNTSVELVVTPAIGYNFVNWTEDGTEVSTNTAYSFTAHADRSLVANFILQTITITVNANPNAGGTFTGAGTYDYNSMVELVATPATGYDFVNWTVDGTVVSTNQTFSFTAEADRSLVANFILQTITITVNANPAAGGTFTGAGTYDYNSIVELVATTATGYDFVNWTESGTQVSTNQTYGFTAQVSRTLVANFSVINSISNINGGNTNLRVFPNPAKDVLTIQIIENKELDNRLLISLIDATGKTVQFDFKNNSDGLFEVSVADLPAGLYLIDVKMNNKTIGKGRVLIIK